MSTSNNQNANDPNSLLYYAPRRLRARASALRTTQLRSGEGRQSVPTASLERASLEPPAYDSAPPPSPLPEILHAPEPAAMEAPWHSSQRAQKKQVFALTIPFAAVAGLAAGVAFLYVMNFTGLSNQHAVNEVAGTPKTEDSKEPAQKTIAPKIAIENGDANINEPLSLGVKVTDSTPGEIVTLSGFPADTKLTTGASAGTGEWRVAVNDLPVTSVIPPRDFVGQMNIVAELSGNFDHPALRNVVRLGWKQITPPPGTTARVETSGSNAPSSSTAASEIARKIDPKEIAALIKRAETLLSTGDVPAARLLLQRAAEAHNAQAAFALATSYDPILIKRLGSYGAQPDLALAREWYQKARDWGSPDAPKYLEALASANR